MPSFIVLRWKSALGRERATALAGKWRTQMNVVVSNERLVALLAAGLSPSSPSPGMMLLGEVYGGAPRAASGTPADRLSRLTRETWGDYLAIISAGDSCLAMVDPSGAGRAHLASDADLTLVTDALTPALMRTAGFEIEVDLPALAGCLVDPGTIASAPLLSGVVPMIAGVAYDLDDRLEPRRIWSPLGLPAEDRDGRELRGSVVRAVGGMLRGRTPLIELSGGLDSSIVAGVASDLGMSPSAVNLELIGGDVGEVGYARATAERCGIDLRAERAADYPDLAAMMGVEQVAHPYVYGVDSAFAVAIEAACRRDIDCVVTGQGGDAVFYQPATHYTTIDRFRALGWRRAGTGLFDDARRSATSIWSLLRAVAADDIHGTALPQDDLGASLLTRAAREDGRRFIHPWLADAGDGPPGRRLQLAMLANSQMFHSARAFDPDRRVVHPLLSQPVLEAALSIPTWRLACGPLDRGLARRVFGDLLAPEVAVRRSKGAAAAFYSRAALANLSYLRQRLLDGALAAAGLVDRSALERALTPETLFYTLDYPALILHASAEAWLSAWMDRG